jgi:hypothetical protein
MPLMVQKYIIVLDYSGTAFCHQKDTGALCLNIPYLIKRFKGFVLNECLIFKCLNFR